MVAHKCAQHNDELGRIAIASRNISKCQAIIDSVKAKGSLKVPADIQAFSLNALDVEATKALIRETESQIVINVGSAFLNMSVLRACIDTGAAYRTPRSTKSRARSAKRRLGTATTSGNTSKSAKQRTSPPFSASASTRCGEQLRQTCAATVFRPH